MRWLLLLLAGCVSDLVYHCDDTHVCDNGGVCISGGCALPATDCPSGLRFNDDSPQKGCVTGAVDCFNNLDDDCDGKIDCADTDCQTANECAPDPTANFSAGTIVTQVQS